MAGVACSPDASVIPARSWGAYRKVAEFCIKLSTGLFALYFVFTTLLLKACRKTLFNQLSFVLSQVITVNHFVVDAPSADFWALECLF